MKSRSSERQIHFVLPDDYTGPFVIISNPDYPDRIVKHADRYELTIPSDGVIRTENVDIFSRWHTWSVAYVNGAMLESTGEPPNRLYGLSGGTVDNRTYYDWFFVGPRGEFKRIYESFDNKAKMKWLESRGESY